MIRTTLLLAVSLFSACTFERDPEPLADAGDRADAGAVPDVGADAKLDVAVDAGFCWSEPPDADIVIACEDCCGSYQCDGDAGACHCIPSNFFIECTP